MPRGSEVMDKSEQNQIERQRKKGSRGGRRRGGWRVGVVCEVGMARLFGCAELALPRIGHQDLLALAKPRQQEDESLWKGVGRVTEAAAPHQSLGRAILS